MMRPGTLGVCALLIISIVGIRPAIAARSVYEYRVENPTYGQLGTYTNVINQAGDDTEVDSSLRVKVTVLGIVIYREEANRVEHWRGDRLLSFESVTVVNGDKIVVHGEARGDGFAITSPSGTVTAPANIRPSNPWRRAIMTGDVLMSTKTGEVLKAQMSGGEEQPVSFDGNAMRLHRYEVLTSAKREFVWFDDNGVLIAIQTDQLGYPIYLVLNRQASR